MPITDFDFIELNNAIDLSSFDCGDAAINEFLKQDAVLYQNQWLSKTHLFVTFDKKIVAFFSISNDCLEDLGEEEGFTNKVWNRFHRRTDIPNAKRIRQYPAVKVGRLGVNASYPKSGIAYGLMDFIKGWIVLESKAACRLLLLDAYNQPKQLNYYHKMALSSF